MKTSTITNGFRRAGLLHDGEEDTATALLRVFDSDTDNEDLFGFESDNEGKKLRVDDVAILSLFVSDTGEEDFGGFSAQEDGGE